MKKLIKKIFKEEIHDEYKDTIKEEDIYLNPTIVELKIGLLAINEIRFPKSSLNSYSSDNSYWVSNFQRVLKDTYVIRDYNMLASMILIFFFNKVEDIETAIDTGDINLLYRGPFYDIVIDYMDDEIQEKTEWVDCDICGGHGSVETDCDYCDGDGEIEYNEDEWGECEECGGDGVIETDCDYCGGHGSEEEDMYELSEYSVKAVTKELFDYNYLVTNYNNITDVYKDPNVLFGEPEYQGSETSDILSDFEEEEGEIRDAYSQDIIINKEVRYILNFF
jgi:hypothetical protein